MIKRAGLTVGFTLIEMSIVLVVIGLILSGGIIAVAPVVQSTKVTETNARMDRIEQALILHVIRFGCLPCPAGNVNSGVAANNPGQALSAAVYTTGCSATVCNAALGIVPWVNLGLSEADILDGFGYRINYRITSAVAAPGNLQADAGMRRTLPVTYPAGALTVGTTTAGVQLTTTAAYVLISHGPDHSLAPAAITGNVAGNPSGSANEALNGGTVSYVQDEVNSSPGGTHFDDIVRWRTAPFIIQLCGNNACGNPE